MSTNLPVVYTIYADMDSMMNLPETDSYLFYNYKWEQLDPHATGRVSSSFTEYEEAAGVYHELYKLRLPRLSRNWF